jgi:hypothetical protein
MGNDDHDPFGGYAPEPQTAGSPPIPEPPAVDEMEPSKYGIGKPRRIIVRGTVAKDTSPDSRRE